MTTKQKGAPSGAPNRRRKQRSSRAAPPLTLTMEDARRLFDGFQGMAKPSDALLAEFVEVANSDRSSQADAGRKSVRDGRQFLSTLEREAHLMVAGLQGNVSEDVERSILADLAPELADEAIAHRKNEIEEAKRTIDNAGHAVADFLNWYRFNFDKPRKTWHEKARSLGFAARWVWSRAGCRPPPPTLESPLTTLVAQALSCLGFRASDGAELSNEAVSAVLTGKRGGRNV